MGWITILYVIIGTLSATIAGLYLGAWLVQREAWSYLMLAVLEVSIVGVAGTELWMMHAQTPMDYATALRWFQVPIWSGFVALVGLVYLRLRPRFLVLGWLAVALRTLALAAAFGSGPNLNYAALTGIERVSLLGEPVAIAIGVPNPWMAVGQASLVLAMLFIIDCGISAWRRGEGARSLALASALLVIVLIGTVQVVSVFWGFVRMPILITPLFLLLALVIGAELSLGLPRAARAERDLRLKDAALGLSEQRLSLAAEAADVGFWSLDARSKAVSATPKTRELFGLAPDGELALADFLKQVHPRDRACLEQLVEAALGTNERYRAEFRVLDADGGTRWLASLGRGVGESDGTSRTLMGVSVDITARMDQFDNICRQRTRLERLSRAETAAELSAALAHELNQPLGTILANAEAAQALLNGDSPDLDELREILADIASADHRAAEVIRHLRALVDRGEPQREPLRLDDAIVRVLELLGNEIDDLGVRVDLSLSPGLPPVQADRILIEQVLVNLVDNACAAVAENPAGQRRISVTARADAQGITVAIADNGCGLPDPQRIFDALYTTKPGGLGLGLAIVRSILSSHGGRVWAEPTPPRGATIAFSLPSGGAAS
ncbi:PAS domain S-box protein [Candidatus Competibacter phosphatis]|uniref:histidine kinase n=1 Tax=Candidatus Competibacter phosphatis TaxID=221280 RepID=A0ABX1TFE1_9GAMM|nr:ATP-binding protein [Candidatus Competibacter phosphatis]NMQ18083.1 PAS domain S-box protein [Candidatus Competibacter phosphatis]